MSKSTPSEPSVRDELSANRIDLRWKQPRPIMAPTGTIRTSAPPVMKAPPTDGCDNRARQSPTTSLVRHFTNDPQTRSPATASHRAPPHRTPRITHAHTHTHRHRSFTFFARRRVGLRDRSRFTHPEASISAAKGTARHATEPQTRERPSPPPARLSPVGHRTRTPIRPSSEPRGFWRRPPCTRCRATRRAGNHRSPLTKDRASVAQ